ncbi:MAG TPA: LytTR family DNA-binding domain-containing protein [Pyrinomonadaceae bacterium]|nr:LytTR family DNA-binding domain-containing protein [Pyrinomonadaceae bacterium]
MEKIRALIVDDEVNARKGIRTLLAGDPELEVVGECGDGRAAIESIERLAPDLVLLDVQMPHKNGFEVVGAINLERPPILIFITAWDSYALKAFEVNALDYLLKPFPDERFYQALERAKGQLRERRTAEFSQRLLALVEHYRGAGKAQADAGTSQDAGPLRRFFIKAGGEVNFVPAEEVDWLQAVGYYTKIHAGRNSYLLRGNLGSIEARLDPGEFARIHRSAVVNLSRVRRLKDWFGGECLVVLRDGTELKVSRRYRQRLETLLERLA